MSLLTRALSASHTTYRRYHIERSFFVDGTAIDLSKFAVYAPQVIVSEEYDFTELLGHSAIAVEQQIERHLQGADGGGLDDAIAPSRTANWASRLGMRSLALPHSMHHAAHADGGKGAPQRHSIFSNIKLHTPQKGSTPAQGGARTFVKQRTIGHEEWERAIAGGGGGAQGGGGGGDGAKAEVSMSSGGKAGERSVFGSSGSKRKGEGTPGQTALFTSDSKGNGKGAKAGGDRFYFARGGDAPSKGAEGGRLSRKYDAPVGHEANVMAAGGAAGSDAESERHAGEALKYLTRQIELLCVMVFLLGLYDLFYFYSSAVLVGCALSRGGVFAGPSRFLFHSPPPSTSHPFHNPSLPLSHLPAHR